MKTIKSLLVVAFAAGALVGCQKKEDTLKIGLAGVLTGSDGEIGTAAQRGSELAIEEWNAKGGVLGKKIEIISRDDEGKANQAVAVAQELVAAGVQAVIGHWNSGCTLPASEIYHKAGILQVTAASTNPQVTERGISTLFRMCGRDDQQGVVMANFAFDSLKVTQVAVLHNKTAYGQGIADEFKKSLEARGGKVVFFDGLASEEMDFRGVIAAIQKSGAQAVYFGGMYGQGGPFFNQLRQAGIKGAVMGGDGIYDAKMIESVGAQAESLFVTFGPDPATLPGAQKLFADYKARFKAEPGGYTVYGYDAANTLLAAIQKAGTTDAAKVAETLRSNSWPTLLGGAEFDAKGDLKKANFVIWTQRAGKYVVR
jgi:branched-chain amino acid transport system substrate-binding protein